MVLTLALRPRDGLSFHFRLSAIRAMPGVGAFLVVDAAG